MRRGLVTLALLAALLAWARPANAASITFASQSVQVGALFDVNILVTGLEEPIFGFLVNFTFDSTILALQGVAAGSFMSPANFNSEPLFPGVGFQTITNFLNEGTTSGTSGILATLTFLAQSPGPGSLEFPVGVGEFFFLESALVGENGLLPLALNPTGEQINVLAPTSVPEPSSLGLLGVGLLALARRLRRKTPVAR